MIRVCKQLTFAVLYWQCTGVAIYFLPTGKYNKYFKAFSVLGFMFMHASFGMCLNLEQFTVCPPPPRPEPLPTVLICNIVGN